MITRSIRRSVLVAAFTALLALLGGVTPASAEPLPIPPIPGPPWCC